MSYYFDKNANVESKEVITKSLINGNAFTFITDNGVFSKKGLDFGTRTLLESINDVSGKVLDLGCGYGPIGIYLAKTFNASVDMVDVNKRSINLAIKNAKLNEVNVNIFESDGYSNINTKYDYIVTNPPIRVGKKILYKLLFDAKYYLNEDGIMYLVVNKDQGAKSLFKDLEKEYLTSIISKNKGFMVFECKMK